MQACTCCYCCLPAAAAASLLLLLLHQSVSIRCACVDLKIKQL
jgi:hypothetical protein